MAESIVLPGTADREVLRSSLLPQIEALLGPETDVIAAMANISAALKEAFGWHWIGFYRVLGDELVLGPFQGPVACSRIAFGKGVCGTAWKEDRTVIVPDVEEFPGHIACSALSRSEIAVPVRDRNGAVKAVLDVDSSDVKDFNDADAAFLEKVCLLIQRLV
jgi:GAF domain-containing protein